MPLILPPLLMTIRRGTACHARDLASIEIRNLPGTPKRAPADIVYINFLLQRYVFNPGCVILTIYNSYITLTA